MPERATINQIVQIGVEATPGTAVAATRRLQAVMIDPNVKADIQTFRPSGGKFATVAALRKEWVEGKITGTPTYNELTYLLASFFSKPTPVQLTPPSGTAYRWDFEIVQDQVDSVATYTVEYGSSVRGERFAYAMVTEFGLSLARNKQELKGTLMAQPMQDPFTLTTTGVSALPQVPVLPTQVDVFLDTTGAALGTTKLGRALSVDLDLKSRFGPVFVLDSTSSGYVAHVETVPKPQIKLVLEADAQGMGLLQAMRGGNPRFLRLRATGPVIEGTTTYLLQMDACAFISAGHDLGNQDGLYIATVTFDVGYDAAWGHAITAQLVNTVSTL